MKKPSQRDIALLLISGFLFLVIGFSIAKFTTPTIKPILPDDSKYYKLQDSVRQLRLEHKKENDELLKVVKFHVNRADSLASVINNRGKKTNEQLKKISNLDDITRLRMRDSLRAVEGF